MAKTNSPLLSLDASGSIGNTITYQHAIGLHTAKSYTTPKDTNSPAQQLSRQRLSTAVWCWNNRTTDPAMRAGWYTYGNLIKGHQTGYSAFVRSMLQLQQIRPDPDFSDSMESNPPHTVNFYIQNIVSGTQGDEPGLFEIWAGPKPNRLLFLQEKAINYQGLQITTTGTPGDTVFFQVFKDGWPRSGIVPVITV